MTDPALPAGPDRTVTRPGGEAPSAETPDPSGFPVPGEALAPDLVVVGELGRGGMSRVYLARDPVLDRDVAVKFLATPPGAPEEVERWLLQFDLEARATARLAHPGVVSVYRAGRWRGRPYLVLERLHGRTLRDDVRGPLPVARVLGLGRQLARALAYCHARSVAHRDLTPGNVWLTPAGDVKLLDLGLASLPNGAAALPGAGTPAWTPPERLRGEVDDQAGDLFCLGVMLCWLLTGRTATDPSSIAALRERPELPPALATLVEALLSSRPADRPVADEVEHRLARIEVERAHGGDPRPFRYLEAFDEGDEGWFVGREGEVERLVALAGEHPKVLVVGPSGAGKSSLVRAGALHHWRRSGRDVVVFRPGRDPLAALAAVGEGGQGRLHVVDAFEELFTVVGDPAVRAAFATFLARRSVVAVCREEFLSRSVALLSSGAPESVRLMVVLPPSVDALRRALEVPAARAGYTLEPGLAEDLLAGLDGETTPLPLLQLAASRVWEARDRAHQVLRRDTLRNLGGVTGLLAVHAEEVLAGVPSEQLPLARRLLEALVTADGTRRSSPRAALVADGGGAAEAVLERLVRGRLLTARSGDDGPSIELAHEALIQRWDRLARWLGEHREDRRLAERVREAARHWVDEGRPPGLLWRDEGLGDARRLRARDPGSLGADGAAFVLAGEAADVRRSRLLRGATVAVVVAALAVAGATLGAAAELRARSATARREADRAGASAREAHARARVLESREALADDPRAALALAVEAFEADPEAATDALRASMQVPWVEAALVGHTGMVHDARFSPDGTRIVSVSQDGTGRLWALDGTLQAVLHGHEGVVAAAPFLPDGRVVTRGVDGRVILWSAEGRQERIVWTFGSPVADVAVSPDGTRLAACTVDGAVAWVELADEGAGGRFVAAETTLTVRWSPDGASLLVGCGDGAVRRFDLRGRTEAVLRAASDGGTMGVFSPDGSRVAVVSMAVPEVTLWASSGGLLTTLPGHGSPVSYVFANQGLLTTLGWRDQSVRLWTFDGQAGAVINGQSGRTTDVTFSPDGQAWVAGDDAGSAGIWDLAGRRRALLPGHVGWVTAVDWAPDGSRVLTAGQDGTVRVWALDDDTRAALADRRREALTGRMDPADPRRPRNPEERRTSTVWTHGGRELAWRRAPDLSVQSVVPVDGGVLTASGDRFVRWWASDGTLGAEVDVGWPAARLVVAPDHSAVAVLTDRDEARVLSVPGLLPEPALPGVRTLLLGPGGGLVATGGADGTLRVWRDGVVAWSALAHPFGVDQLASVAGGGLATRGDTEVRLWHADGTPGPSLAPGFDVVWMSASPDGTALLVTGPTGEAALVDADSAEVRPLEGHDTRVSDAVFLPGGDVVTVAWDGGIRRYVAMGGPPVAELRSDDHVLATVAASRDGEHLLVGGVDGLVRRWTFDGAPPSLLVDHGAPVSAVAFDPAERWALSWSADAAVHASALDPSVVLTAARARLAASPEIPIQRGAPGAYGSMR